MLLEAKSKDDELESGELAALAGATSLALSAPGVARLGAGDRWPDDHFHLLRLLHCHTS
jgi:hypothetical protein